jgi:transposase
MNDCGAKSKLPAPLIYLSKTGNYRVVKSPRDFSVHRPSWTTALLAKLVKDRFKIDVTEECIRQHLERLDIVCRRPTWTVKHKAQEKPGHAQKKGLLQGY